MRIYAIILLMMFVLPVAHSAPRVTGLELINSSSQQLLKDCSVSSFLLYENDKKYKMLLDASLLFFGGLKAKNFDMGQCIDEGSVYKNSIIVMNLWQKNNSFLGQQLQAFVAYDPQNKKLLTLLIDEELNSYLLGSKDNNLIEAIQENEQRKTNHSEVNFKSINTFKDFGGDLKPEGDWSDISCKKDKFDDTKFCYFAQGPITAYIGQAGAGVFIVGDHYPKSKSAVKIDNNPAIYGVEGSFGLSASKIIEQMKKGLSIYTRYRKWPNDYNIDNEYSLKGFTYQFEQMKKRYSQL